jgi:hypothetical protein
MDWSKGFSSSVYLSVVDPPTWKDISRIEVTGGKVSKDDDSELKESADVDCVNYDQTAERWVRIYMDTRQNGAASHVALFTGLASVPDKDIKGALIETPVQCYSVLKPAQDIYLPRGWYVSGGSDGAGKVAELLNVTPAPKVITEGSPVLMESIIAEDDETNLSMALKILDAINWRLRITGDGTIHICPQAVEVSARFDAEEYDCLETEVSLTYDWFSCPNVFRAISEDMTAIARDDDPDSPLSTVVRGREIWEQETDCDLNTGESIADYAQRRLEELQTASQEIDYDRRFHPDVLPGDLVRIKYPGQGLDGVYKVASQDIDISKSGRTSEESRGV